MLEFSGIFIQQDVATGGAVAPTVVSVTISAIADATTHNVSLPATVASGELLFIWAANDGGVQDNSNTAASGWTRIEVGALNGNVGRSAFIKVADGTEGGTTINITTPTSEYLAAQCFRIQDWSGNTANIAIGTEVSGTNLVTPPALTSGFGAVPTLWIVSIAYSAAVTLTSAPTNYTGNTAGASSSSNAQIFTGYRQTTAASETPGAFTTSSPAANATLNTIAIRGTG